MSYDIRLCDPVSKDTIQFESAHRIAGGTYAMGGTSEAWLNITYNYSRFFYAAMGEKGIRTIYGMTGAESLPILKSAAEQLDLGDKKPHDYWKATPANARAALLGLIAFAEMRPDGIWDGD